MRSEDVSNENDFYNTKVVNLILKYLLNNWNFIKIILKASFADWHVLRENWCETIRLVFRHTFRDICIDGDFDASPSILTLVGIGCHTLGEESINFVGPECHGITRWRVAAPSMDSP